MSQTLREYLTEISNDSALLDEYKANPKAALDATQLADSDKELILSGDNAAIRSKLAGDGAVAAGTIVLITIITI